MGRVVELVSRCVGLSFTSGKSCLSTDSTTAIVLRNVEFSETSLIVTLLTRDFGRVSAIAKGARRPKGPFEGSLDLLAVCRVVLIRKSSGSLDLLTEAKLHRRFRAADRSLDRLYGGYHVIEMLRLLMDEHDPHPEVYDLTIQTLGQLDGEGEVASTLAYFDAQLLRKLGHSPGVDRCTACGGEVAATARQIFALATGGIVCANCRARQRQTVSLKQETISELRRLADDSTQYPVSVAANVYGELRGVLNRYIQTVLGSVPRMQPFLPTAIRTEPKP